MRSAVCLDDLLALRLEALSHLELLSSVVKENSNVAVKKSEGSVAFGPAVLRHRVPGHSVVTALSACRNMMSSTKPATVTQGYTTKASCLASKRLAALRKSRQ